MAVLVDAFALDGGAPARRRPVARRTGGGDARRARRRGFAAWQQAGHEVDLYSFGENVSPATTARRCARRPPPTPPASARRWATSATRYAGRDLGAVVVISDGIDTGRIGEGPLDAATRTAIDALGAPVHTVGLGEKSLRDLSVAAVLADQFAFVRTPASIEAVIRQTGLPDRQVEVTLERDGRPIATRSVVLRGDRSEEKIAFDWLPDHPGNFVFRISTPVLAGEALKSNNEQVVRAQGDPRSRARAAPVGPAVVGRALPARDAAPRSQRRPGVVLHPAHRERRAALEPQRAVADPVPDLRDLRGAAAAPSTW